MSDVKPVTGDTLIGWGFTPGPWFGHALDVANSMWNNGYGDDEIYAAVVDLQPAPPVEPREAPSAYRVCLDADPDADSDETANMKAVLSTMDIVMCTPGVGRGAVMPDACPAGPPGNIPVGGVVASPNIHPGMHSADVCCSLACTVVDASPADVLDAAHSVTHFGPGPRDVGPGIDAHVCLTPAVEQEFGHNPFLRGLADHAVDYLGTQGDGNHFLYVGVQASTGRTCVVTHHGSRKPGAELYRRGMRTAEQFRRRLAPRVHRANAWIPGDSREATDYWHALQTIRSWTRANHFCLHDLIVDRLATVPCDRWWNEHNFVFWSNGLYFHAKGATPMWPAYALVADDPYVDARRLVPLNMAEPVLVLNRSTSNRGPADDALGFAPHGAGRLLSRTEHWRRGLYDLEVETDGVDVRWWTGRPDLTELPSAYKPAQQVRDEIERYGLANVVDEIRPYGCIMAGKG